MMCYQPFLSSIFTLGGPDLLIIVVVLLLLSIPFLALNGLINLFRKRRSESPVNGNLNEKTKPDASDRLRQLQTMRNEGLISEDEYQTQRKRVLNSI